ncbi:MAG: hypothetical protein HY675_29285 [Chloroflexi bacterium]|nr:hypothetical protein [Chloroflexota bacterium]
MARRNPLELYSINAELCTGCLICQLRCSLAFRREFNPSKARILIEPVDGVAGNGNIVTFTPECTACGICVLHCGYGALKTKDGA